MSGVVAGLASAVLFGAAAPAAKPLLTDLTAFQLAGLLYLGAVVGISPWALHRRGERRPLDAVTRRRLAGATMLGSIAAPLPLLLALRCAPLAQEPFPSC